MKLVVVGYVTVRFVMIVLFGCVLVSFARSFARSFVCSFTQCPFAS